MSLLSCRSSWLAWIVVGLLAGNLAADDGFESIFDGKSLKGWDGNPEYWRVEDGAIVGQTTPDNPLDGNTFIIYRAGDLANFELRLKFKIQGGNSGIQYRSREVNKWVISGYQADFDSAGNWTGTLYEEKGRGILAKRGNKVEITATGKKQNVGTTTPEDQILAKINKEDWNDYTIIANGNHLIHKVNGVVTVDVVDYQSDKAAKSGLLAMQLHRGPPMTVAFKDIQLKRLPKSADATSAKKKQVIFMAGGASHRYAAHEHNAGCILLAKSLQIAMGDQVDVTVYQNGWPSNPHAFDHADTIVMYCDGGGRHPVIPHLDAVDELARKGVGIVCVHYGVEVPKGDAGDRFLDWIGGYFEAHWSVNPHWVAEFKAMPNHPITRGVKPFAINDEWYYHMRFREGMKNVTPILTAIPPESTLRRRDGSHSGNPHVRKKAGQPQHVAWAAEREGGGRGFGFTGGHVHWNWGEPNFRKLVLNAIVWTAKLDVPQGGVTDRPVSLIELEANQDYTQPKDFDREKIRNQFELPGDKVGQSKAKRVEQFVSTGPPTQPERDPQRAVAALDVADGLQATLTASEPRLLSLTNLDVDHRGRIWVCEVVNYRKHNGKRKEGDRILILEDTDGDGKADKSKVYYQGRDIDSAMGICVLGNRVIVSASPHVFVFTDEDGDDVPDKKELLFAKTGKPQHDHSAHSFVFGPDGKLYWNFGNTGQAVNDRDGKPITDARGNRVVDNGKPYFGGMVFRCNMDGSDFEVLGHNFRNNYEVAVDSFGGLWQSDNDDDGNRGVRINFVVEYGNYGYLDEFTGARWKDKRTGMHQEIPLRHWHLNDPGVMPNLLQTGAGSPTGIMVYEGDLLPKVFRDQVIHCDAGPNVVRAYPVAADGAGYTAKTVNVLHGARDNWFRPADVCVAPDGSLFVTDWYDPGVGGHNMGDLQRGRLFRVAPPGKKYEVPKFDFESIDGCIEALKNPNLSVRYLAWTFLHEQGEKAEPALLKLYEHKNPRYRARALWLLGKIDGRGQHYVDRAIGDRDPNIRIVGLRLARQLNLNLLPIMSQLAHDIAPVRREVCVALREFDGPEAAEVWTALAMDHDGKDRWYLEALGIAADGRWDECLKAWLAVAGDGWNSPAGRDIIWRSRAQATPDYLVKLIQNPKTPVEEHPRYFRAMDFQSGEAKDKALKSLLGGLVD